MRSPRTLIRARGGIPSFIGVPGHVAPFRALAVHLDRRRGRPRHPGKRRIREGQLVSVDAGAIVDGWHGDAARTWIVGEVPARRRDSWSRRPARRCCAGIAAAVPGNYLGDIAAAIEDVALEHGYGVVRAFVGHGIGTEMHEEPQVTNYRTGSRGRRIEPGLCLAIEPMFTLGGHEVRVKPDGWTVETARRQPGRPLGAHHRGHRGRPAHPDARCRRAWSPGACRAAGSRAAAIAARPDGR